MPTEFILIRHGQAARTAGDYTHAPLTPLGRQQAALTGQHLSNTGKIVDAFYASPIRRASETATLIGKEIGQLPRTESGLREISPLEFPALVLLESLAHLGALQGYLRANVGRLISWPIVGRVSTVLTQLASDHPDQTVAIVTHGEVVSGVLIWYRPQERRRLWRETVDNCSLTRVKVEGTRADLLSFNEIGHLQSLVVRPFPASSIQLTEVNPVAGAPADPLGRR